MKKILCIIPARSGSKGIPRKNIKLLNGKPLIAYTSELAKNSRYLDKIIVSTDDSEISEVSRSLGIEVPFIRPKILAQDNSSTLSVIIHALKFYQELDENFEAVCLLQVTSPFRSIEFLEKCLERFINEEPDSLISVKEVPHVYNPHWCFEENNSGYLKIATGEEQIIARRQDLPKNYYRDGCIYITKTKILLENNSMYGDKIAYEINPNRVDVNIDTLKDWKMAEKNLGSIKP